VYFLALAVDYDGTIAENGHVTPETLDALSRLRQSGRKLLLVTGREIVDLQHACRNLEVFDLIVAENGALLYDPLTGQEVSLAPPPPQPLLNKLSELGVSPISVGRSIIATWQPHEQAVMQAIRETGLEMQITFNKGAVMVLPANVNKASGLRQALRDLDISPVNVVAIGDAENDHAFLSACGCSAAVANAVPSVKREVDIELPRDHGAGVQDLIGRLLNEDHKILPLPKRGILAGIDQQGKEVYIAPEELILVAGNSGCGKSSFMTLLTERMVERGQEFCVIDPEGDYLQLEDAVTIGGISEPPATQDALRLLLQADINVVISTLALSLDDRKRLFSNLARSIRHLRKSSGRPHWLIVDEVHHVLRFLQAEKMPAPTAGLGGLLVTVDLGMIHPVIVKNISTLIAMGSMAPDLLASYAVTLGIDCPKQLPRLSSEEFILWSPATGDPPSILRRASPKQMHHRHRGKYATGDVGIERSFYFRGPNLEINLRAHNLTEFLTLGDQVSDTVWQHHLLAGDYSAWFRNVIRDDTLAEQAFDIERERPSVPATTRRRIRRAIQARYRIPTSSDMVDRNDDSSLVSSQAVPANQIAATKLDLDLPRG
jgi:hydroxymethylpyrimidine pyrophosphatase-like HAD family hydrolase/energy-coupling factor transporter ATP-binding protein EcfA2